MNDYTTVIRSIAASASLAFILYKKLKLFNLKIFLVFTKIIILSYAKKRVGN